MEKVSDENVCRLWSQRVVVISIFFLVLHCIFTSRRFKKSQTACRRTFKLDSSWFDGQLCVLRFQQVILGNVKIERKQISRRRIVVHRTPTTRCTSVLTDPSLVPWV